MKTLIELYDDRPVENVLGTEVFKPETTVFLCEAEIAQDKNEKKKITSYFRQMGLQTEVIFKECSRFDTDKIERMLYKITQEYPDCVMDITGGTEAALFACGKFCATSDIPAFTYSRRRNMFFNIHKADFAEELTCNVNHTVSECFRMAGGALRTGRVNNAILDQYMDLYDPFFELYLKYRTTWNKVVSWMVRASQSKKKENPKLKVSCAKVLKGERGNRLLAPERALADMEKLDMIRNLSVTKDRVEFAFRDQQIRTWLRDVGSVLELYVYKACMDAGLFNDVMTSAIVDWEGDNRKDNVTNEIDVMAMQGIFPTFISCKTCSIETEALNELAILRDRFGGEAARAVIVTTQRCQSITRHRAAELNIDVIDLDDLKKAENPIRSIKNTRGD